jgi:4-amino-4-deoxy-L-arabinose transferase-like glycosyltransferase
VALALTSPFLRYTLVHAWAEAPLACFLLLAALLAAVGARRLLAGRGWLRWAVGLGLALGLASATKLTGLVGIPIVVGTATVLAMLAWRDGQPAAARRLVGWSLLAAVIALIVFVAVNPYLWRGSVAGLLGMLDERRDEMAFQQQQWPEYAVVNPIERPLLTAVGSTRVGPWADLAPVAVPLGLGLAALDGGFLIGMLLPSSQVEDERLGDLSDDLKQQAREIGSEAVDRGKSVAQDAAQQVSATVEESGREQAQGLADSLRQSAEDVRSRG